MSAAAKRIAKLIPTTPASARRAGIAAGRGTACAREKETSTATGAASAGAGRPLRGGCLGVAAAHAGVEGVAGPVRPRDPAVRGAQLFAASGFALAQPL